MSDTEAKQVTQFKAIKIEVENEQTGAIANYHVPTSITIDFANKLVAVNFASYVSERTYKAGKMSVGYIYKQVSTEELPSIDASILEQIVAQEGSELFGGELA